MELTYKTCDTCLAIRRDRRGVGHEYWAASEFWKPLAESIPEEVRMDAGMEELHILHHAQGDYPDALIFVGLRVIIAYLDERNAGMVPAEEMRRKLTDQFDQMYGERKAIEATADEAARAEYAGRLRVAYTQLANVDAILTRAFHAKHKTLRYDEVRDAARWQDGDELPELTREHLAREAELRRIPKTF